MKQTTKIGLAGTGARGTIRWIDNQDLLQRSLDSGLNQLFRDVFGAPPYNEVFTTREVDIFFTNYLSTGADILSISEDLNGTPIAFMVGIPLSNEFKKVSSLPTWLFNRKTSYIAEDGVSKDWRRMGLSSYMKSKMLTKMKIDGYEFTLLRTRADNTPQITAVAKAGGAKIPYAQQIVPRNTRNGLVQEDNRFFLFDLRMK